MGERAIAIESTIDAERASRCERTKNLERAMSIERTKCVERTYAAAPTFSVSVRRLFLRMILICSPYQSQAREQIIRYTASEATVLLQIGDCLWNDQQCLNLRAPIQCVNLVA